MSTALVSGFYDFGDILSYKSHHFGLSEKKQPARRVASMTLSSNLSTSNTTSPQKIVSMHQKLSTTVLQSTGHHNPPQSPLLSPSNVIMPPQQALSLREHRKLDRSLSEPVHQQQPPPMMACRSNSAVVGSPVAGAAATAAAAAAAAAAAGTQANSSRYKTELCRPFEENGTCKYGDKCQFAHGYHELRTLARHPKYKTELCRTFHTTGFCPYGPRCHFIHNSEETKKGLMSNMHPSSNGGLATRSNSIGGDVGNRKGDLGSSRQHLQSRPKALSIGSFSLGSAGDLSSPSSLSGSPTSLNGFFADDIFFNNNQYKNQHQNQQHQNQQQNLHDNLHENLHDDLHESPHEGQHENHHENQAPSTPNTAFSFSQDFAKALANHKMSAIGMSINLPYFSGSQPILAQSSVASVYLASPPSASSDFLEDTVNTDPLFTFPDAPPSPVDSVSSEIERINKRSGSPPSSHLQQGQASSADALLGNPRLPIFSRLSNGSDSE